MVFIRGWQAQANVLADVLRQDEVTQAALVEHRPVSPAPVLHEPVEEVSHVLATCNLGEGWRVAHLALSAAIVASLLWLRTDDPRWKLTTVMHKVSNEPNVV